MSNQVLRALAAVGIAGFLGLSRPSAADSFQLDVLGQCNRLMDGALGDIEGCLQKEFMSPERKKADAAYAAKRAAVRSRLDIVSKIAGTGAVHSLSLKNQTRKGYDNTTEVKGQYVIEPPVFGGDKNDLTCDFYPAGQYPKSPINLGNGDMKCQDAIALELNKKSELFRDRIQWLSMGAYRICKSYIDDVLSSEVELQGQKMETNVLKLCGVAFPTPQGSALDEMYKSLESRKKVANPSDGSGSQGGSGSGGARSP